MMNMQLDGRRAYLPHPIFQNCLFAATRERKADEYRKRSVTVERRNRWGDVLTIRSARTLFARPDMGVFLAVVALIQKNGFQRLVGERDGVPSGRLASHFSLSALYDLTGMARSRGRENLLVSLDTLGSVAVSIQYADPGKHAGRAALRLSTFWDLKIMSRKGRVGSTVDIYPAEFLVPQERFIWADAEICNRLRSDTARGIFWALLCREHMRGTAQEWKGLVGAGGDRIDKWTSRQLRPALEELAKHGYHVAEDDDQILVRRPGVKTLDAKCTIIGP